MKKVTGCVARNIMFVTRNMQRWERQEAFVCRWCHWSELYDQMIGTVNTEVHFRSIVRRFLIFFITPVLNIFIWKKPDIFIKLHRTYISTDILFVYFTHESTLCLKWSKLYHLTIIYWTTTTIKLFLIYCFLRRWKLDTSEIRLEIFRKLLNVVLEEHGEYQLDWSCEKWKKYYKESRRRGISYVQYKKKED